MHPAAALVWMGAWVLGHSVPRPASPAIGLTPKATPTIPIRVGVAHLALLLLLASGGLMMFVRGWGLGHAPWLTLKIGLVLGLVLPLEGFHAYVCHVFIPRAQKVRGPSGERQVERGAGMEEMVRMLAIPLLGLAIPLVLWLSFGRPF